MTAVTRMRSQDAFLEMPLEQRNCEVELYEDCRTRKLVEECNCVPWELPGYEGIKKCSPKGRDCIENNSVKTFNCSITCDGMYADIWKDGNMKDEMENEKYTMLSSEYQNFKRENLKIFRFSFEAAQSNFGKQILQ